MVTVHSINDHNKDHSYIVEMLKLFQSSTGTPKMERLSPGISPSPPPSTTAVKDPVHTYFGISFFVHLSLLPHHTRLRSRVRSLTMQLFHAEEKIRQMSTRRREDSQANARVVGIFASHRNEWQREERRLLEKIETGEEEIGRLKEKVAQFEDEVRERDAFIDKLMDRRKAEEEERVEVEKEMEMGGGKEEVGVGLGFEKIRVEDVCFEEKIGLGGDELAMMMGSYGKQQQRIGYGRKLSSEATLNCWVADRSSNCWQGPQYESLETQYSVPHSLPRRESPWNVDCESTGVSSKLKLLEQELTNLEKIGNGELSRVPSLMKKQSKRYQSLSVKIYDLCRKMQVSDASDRSVSPEFRTQRQTEFLMEAFRLQQRATETRQKLTAIQAETTSCCIGDERAGQSKVSTRKSLESIRNNFKEIQRNLEVLMARIIGDLEGILAREGASNVRDYYMSRYPFVR